MEEINIGDVVQLKSGGTQMTVEDISKGSDGKDVASCCWFINGEYKNEKIYTTALKKYVPKPAARFR
ncbi:DUF2158 domain-containing protein [Sphingobacterium multivorum]|uniref:YodC family protein n=1 Tax=Sphingobacterium multivorum TaxID=28454 RepID=UPI001917BE90|nr:DUF2158 domain-containing protein [Sphingobacterium multivorum]QQT60973.1 DUF2158 domain-containing protein [Sphingobacterium multivorum]